eukprot:596165-Rhodomonas_salina.1
MAQPGRLPWHAHGRGRLPAVGSATCLRICEAMPGTDVAYGATRALGATPGAEGWEGVRVESLVSSAICLRACCATSAYGAIRRVAAWLRGGMGGGGWRGKLRYRPTRVMRDVRGRRLDGVVTAMMVEVSRLSAYA